MSLKPGSLLKDRYRILSVLGQGGMGAVYRANDEILSVSVAVKENLFLAEEYTRQFQREASILASLRHPNLPRVGDYCSIIGQGQYLIMDYIEGEDLRQRIARLKTLPENEVILIGVMICEALSYLHSRQPPIIHRDIKPGNIKITPEGDVFLVDFGLAKAAEDPHQATITGARAMTPGYSPPEQYGTARTDARTDIYSLGATIYAALTGEIPEDGLARITGRSKLTPVLSWRPGISVKLAEVIEHALAVDSDERYQTAADFKHGLLEVGEIGHLFQERPTITPPPLKAVMMNNSLGESNNPDVNVLEKDDLAHQSWFRKIPVLPKWWMGVFIASMVLLLVLSFFIPGNLYNRILQNNPTITLTNEVITATKGKATSTNAVINPPTKDPTSTEVLKTSTQSVTLTPTLFPTNTPQQATPTNVSLVETQVGGNSMIAFVSDRSGNEQIWTMLPNGSQQRQVTSLDYGACQPAFSPDGQKIVFISPCTGKQDNYSETQLYITDLEGSSITPVPVPFSPQGDFDPAWSPDGNKIAFTSWRTGVMHIYVYDLESDSLHELSSTLYSDRYPAWSPDGKQIAFIHSKLNSIVWTMSDSGNFVSQFSRSGNVNNISPAWSPDGLLIIYSQIDIDDGGYPHLAGLKYEDRGTSGEFRIHPTGIDASYPVSSASFSPDGNWIVFESWPDGRNHDIYIMDLEGNQLTRITTDPGFDFDPTWSLYLP